MRKLKHALLNITGLTSGKARTWEPEGRWNGSIVSTMYITFYTHQYIWLITQVISKSVRLSYLLLHNKLLQKHSGLKESFYFVHGFMSWEFRKGSVVLFLAPCGISWDDWDWRIYFQDDFTYMPGAFFFLVYTLSVCHFNFYATVQPCKILLLLMPKKII